MSVWVGLFVGFGLGVLFTAFVGGRSYRDELRLRDEWEAEARSLVREIATTPHFPAWIRTKAKQLLADEAGA